MSEHRDATLIVGYVPGTDFYPREIALPQPSRLAVGFNCYYPSVAGGSFLDNDLIVATCHAIIGTRRSVAYDQDGLPLTLATEDAADKLGRILVYEEDATIAYLQVCRWDAIGGPPDYHDRYTLELFTSPRYFDDIYRAVEIALAAEKCRVRIVHYPQIPKQPGLLSRFFRRLDSWMP